MTLPSYRPGGRILEAAQQRPNDAALIVDDESWSYRELLGAARGLAERLVSARCGDPQPTTAVLAHWHVSSYIGLLAARLAGHALLPIAVNHPPARSAERLRRAKACQIICGERAEASLAAMLGCDEAKAMPAGDVHLVHCPDDKAGWSMADNFDDWRSTRPATLEDIAYILFTSGSTGRPKGVPFGNAQWESFLQATRELLEVAPGDRPSQNFELCFDPGLHDLFVCWEAGATLVVPSAAERRNPAAYIRDRQLTHWYSVPSLARRIALQGNLKPGAFPSLRVSMFCGEALYTALAAAWAEAAPNSNVENWYGPTETQAVCRHIVDPASTASVTVPIGKAFPRMDVMLLDDRLAPCAADEVGEVFIAGGQVVSGYLDDPEETRKRFVTLPDGRFAYRTGDRASLCDDGLRFLGRADSQIKLLGQRIELGEVEWALAGAAQGRDAVVLAWPPAPVPPIAILAVVETGGADDFDPAELRRRLARRVAPGMAPARIYAMRELPRNTNGKVDRQSVERWLAAEIEGARQPRGQGRKGTRSREAQLLMDAVLEQAPHLSRRDILNARNLLDAGLDSLGFVGLTAALEERFELALDERTVVELGEMPFSRIVDELRVPRGVLWGLYRKSAAWRVAAVDSLRRLTGKPRIVRAAPAGRVAQFVQRFPAHVQARGAPDVLVVGSSGAFHAFSPSEFEAQAAAHGRCVKAVNAACPAVHAAEMRRLCDFIKAHCGASRKGGDAADVGPVVLFEIDLVHMSTEPPAGRVLLDRDMLAGNVVVRAGADMSAYEWRSDTAGARDAPQDVVGRRKALWMMKRDRVVLDVYRGAVPFNPAAVDDWLAAASALRSAAGRLVCFLPPISPDVRPQGEDGACVAGVARKVERTLNVRMLTWQDFDLAATDFADIGHLHPGHGRRKFSRQLARLLYDGASTRRADDLAGRELAPA